LQRLDRIGLLALAIHAGPWLTGAST
jgi:hypothetical protein